MSEKRRARSEKRGARSEKPQAGHRRSSLLAHRFSASELGRRGEARAVWYYRLRGYRILDRNVRLGRGEIDLVVRRGRSVALVEVKTRQQRDAGEGFEAVDGIKEGRLADLADRYLASRRLDHCEIRFDVVSLFWTGRRFRLKCFQDAFRFEADERYPWKNK